jgi:hypothetical protein
MNQALVALTMKTGLQIQAQVCFFLVSLPLELILQML